MTCLGCGRDIPWDGRGSFCYTCTCGATVFVGDSCLTLPASLGLGLAQGKELAHLSYYVGLSSDANELKRHFIGFLRTRGATWPWECSECLVQRCPFITFRCDRPFSPNLDDKALAKEFCGGKRHQDCSRYRELKEQVVAIEATTD